MVFRLPPPAPPKRYHVASTDEYASFFLLLRSCHVTITVEWYVVPRPPPLQSLPRGEYSGAAFCSDLRRSQHATRVESKGGFWNVVPKSTLGPPRQSLERRSKVHFRAPKADFGTPLSHGKVADRLPTSLSPTLSFKFPERPQRNFKMFSATFILVVPAYPLLHGRGAERLPASLFPHAVLQVSVEDQEKL